MIALEYLKNKNLRAVIKDFNAVFGGFFALQSPSATLIYVSESQEKSAYKAPNAETADGLIQTLQDSIAENHNLLVERWPIFELKPNRLY